MAMYAGFVKPADVPTPLAEPAVPVGEPARMDEVYTGSGPGAHGVAVAVAADDALALTFCERRETMRGASATTRSMSMSGRMGAGKECGCALRSAHTYCRREKKK
jgi:hypothetical protein